MAKSKAAAPVDDDDLDEGIDGGANGSAIPDDDDVAGGVAGGGPDSADSAGTPPADSATGSSFVRDFLRSSGVPDDQLGAWQDDQQALQALWQGLGTYQQRAQYQEHQYAQLQAELAELRKMQKQQAQQAEQKPPEEFKWPHALPEYDENWLNMKEGDRWMDPTIPVKIAQHQAALVKSMRQATSEPHKYFEPLGQHWKTQWLKDAEKLVEDKLNKFAQRYENDTFIRDNEQRFLQDGQPTQEWMTFQHFYSELREKYPDVPVQLIRQSAEDRTTAYLLQQSAGRQPASAAQMGKSPQDKAEDKRQQFRDKTNRSPSRSGAGRFSENDFGNKSFRQFAEEELSDLD